MSARLAIMVPSRGRPRNIERLSSVVHDTADDPVDIIVQLDRDDPMRPHYPLDLPNVHYLTIDRVRLAASWNQLAFAYGETYPFMAFWGDDVVPSCRGWDTSFVSTLMERGPGFVYGPDGVWDHTYDKEVPGHLVLPTAVVADTRIIKALGYVAPPGLVHLCIDVAWRDLGVATDSLFYRPDVPITHLHRCVGAPDDATYREANDNGAQVRADSFAIRRWREGQGFRDACAAVRRVRELAGYGVHGEAAMALDNLR